MLLPASPWLCLFPAELVALAAALFIFVLAVALSLVLPELVPPLFCSVSSGWFCSCCVFVGFTMRNLKIIVSIWRAIRDLL